MVIRNEQTEKIRVGGRNRLFTVFFETVPSDQNMMKPQMRNSYEFRLVQVSSYSGQTVLGKKVSVSA